MKAVIYYLQTQGQKGTTKQIEKLLKYQTLETITRMAIER